MKSKKKKGFTLVELIVVIVIIGILAAVLVPSLTKYIDKANYSKDVQSVKTLNTYLENNSLLFYDMEINSREDVIELLKAENPDKELNLTVKSKGYYLWYDIDNKEIILETYENLEGKSSKQKLSARNSNSDRSCLSEFFEGYYFLDEGDSSLYKVIEIIDNLKDKSIDDVPDMLRKALISVKEDNFETAYNEYVKYLNGLSIDIDFNTKWVVSIFIQENNPIVTIGEKLCEHKNTEIIYGKAATCEEDGLTDGEKCTDCGNITKEQTVISALGHKEVTDEAKAPTCTETGLTEGSHCSVCGKVLVKQETLPTKHDIVHHEKVNATCTEAGSKEHWSCQNCNKLFSDSSCKTEITDIVITALGHDEQPHDAQAPTCTEVGWKAYVTCSRCDYSTYHAIDAKGHEYGDLISEVSATCTKDGIKEHYHCEVCNKDFDKDKNELTDLTIKTPGHQAKVTKDGKAATCTETGLTEEKTCSVCGEIVQKQEVIKATGHMEVIDEAKAATCTETGLTEGKHCSVCKEVLVKQDVTSVLGHDELSHDAQAATCEGKGWEAYVTCSRCDYTTYKEIKALGHDYSTEWSSDDTNHYHECSRCKDKKDVTEHDPDHDEATEKDGIKCTVCGYVIEAQKEHVHKLYMTVQAKSATCTEDGNKLYYVCECGKKFKDSSLKEEINDETIVIKAGHKEAIDKAVEATCTETGLTEGKHCSVCNIVLVAQKVVEAKDHTYDDNMKCKVCGYVNKVVVKFVLPDDEDPVYQEDVILNSGVSAKGIEEAINKCNDKVSKESNYQVFKEFLGWYDKDDSTKTLVTDFSKMTENKVFVALIKETVRSYNINIYYEDKDNAVADSTYLASETIKNHKFGTDINIKKQIQYNSLYLFYMSPKATFDESDWLNLVNNISNKDSNGVISLLNSKKELEFLANIKVNEDSATGTLELVVLCVQPAAIVSTNSSIAWKDSGVTPSENCEFYLTVEEALLKSNNGQAEYIRIYGQSIKSVNSSAYLPDTTPPIPAHSLKTDIITYAIPSYSLDIASKYTLGGNKEFTIEKEDTVILPYARNDATSDGYLLEQTGSPLSDNIIHSYLVINKNATLNVNGKIVVGGVVVSWGQYAVGIVSTRAVVMNNGNIICNSGAEVLSYGYIKGESGTLELKNGATLVDVFKSYDYPGGSISTMLNTKSIFPIQVYSFHNVSCELKINYGATFKVYGQIYASGNFIMKEDITILGTKGMFELTDEDGYILKSVEDATKEDTYINTKFTSSNQDVTQREVLNIYGSFKDNSIKLKLFSSSDLLAISTSKSKAMPIGLMKIVLNKGTGVLSSVSYKFLPGSELTINDDATLEIKSGVNVVFYDSSYDDNFKYIVNGSETTANFRYSIVHSAWFSQEDTSKIGSKLIVNGYLNVEGGLGGKIDSISSDGKVLISKEYAEIREPTEISIRVKYETTKYYAKGIINGSEANFEKNIIYYYNSDKKCWNTVEN